MHPVDDLCMVISLEFCLAETSVLITAVVQAYSTLSDFAQVHRNIIVEKKDRVPHIDHKLTQVVVGDISFSNNFPKKVLKCLPDLIPSVEKIQS